MSATDVSLLASGLAVAIALFSWREARRANRRGERVDVNVTYGGPKGLVSAYSNLTPDQATAELHIVLEVVGTGVASPVRVFVHYDAITEDAECVATFERLNGGASRDTSIKFFPTPKDTLTTWVEWHDVDGRHETDAKHFTFRRGLEGRGPPIHVLPT